MNTMELTVKLVQAAAKHTGLLPSRIIGRGRCVALCEARWAIWLAMRSCGLTLAEIGQAFRRNHATVLVALRRAAEHRGDREIAFRALCDSLKETDFETTISINSK
jgi:chromosomal replication initiation ATPase DnaA